MGGRCLRATRQRPVPGFVAFCQSAVQRMGNRVAAIVDRVTFNAHILQTGTRSYRLATSKTRSRKPAS
jgi:hypothetical protein